jgi:outer membrane lipoprotein-sorting protein
MWVKEKFCRFIVKKKTHLSLITILFYFLFFSCSKANFHENLINKYKEINTLTFDFTQKISDKVEFGNCFIKYPLLMKCEYPKKKKSMIANGKKLAIIKRRYKKIYYYPLKKTPLFYLLKKENIINAIQNYEPILNESNIIEYKLIDKNSSSLKIFFDKKSLDLLGWKTVDTYSNEVIFLIRNIKSNVLIKNDFFKIPKEEDL